MFGRSQLSSNSSRRWKTPLSHSPPSRWRPCHGCCRGVLADVHMCFPPPSGSPDELAVLARSHIRSVLNAMFKSDGGARPVLEVCVVVCSVRLRLRTRGMTNDPNPLGPAHVTLRGGCERTGRCATPSTVGVATLPRLTARRRSPCRYCLGRERAPRKGAMQLGGTSMHRCCCCGRADAAVALVNR